MKPRALPTAVRQRLERLAMQPRTIEAWWTHPLARYGDRPPCDLHEWELEELLRKLEDARRIMRSQPEQHGGEP